MKHISKKVLLFGALSMLISSVPMQAMENAPADVQKEVAQKQGFFSRWTQKAKQARLKTLMKELDQNWKPFIKCIVKGGDSCPKKLVWTIRGLLASIIALVAIKAVQAGVAGDYVGAREYAKKRPIEDPVRGALIETEFISREFGKMGPEAGRKFITIPKPAPAPTYAERVAEQKRAAGEEQQKEVLSGAIGSGRSMYEPSKLTEEDIAPEFR